MEWKSTHRPPRDFTAPTDVTVYTMDTIFRLKVDARGQILTHSLSSPTPTFSDHGHNKGGVYSGMLPLKRTSEAVPRLQAGCARPFLLGVSGATANPMNPESCGFASSDNSASSSIPFSQMNRFRSLHSLDWNFMSKPPIGCWTKEWKVLPRNRGQQPRLIGPFSALWCAWECDRRARASGPLSFHLDMISRATARALALALVTGPNWTLKKTKRPLR